MFNYWILLKVRRTFNFNAVVRVVIQTALTAPQVNHRDRDVNVNHVLINETRLENLLHANTVCNADH
jgi:hypothetical protein